MIKRFWDFALKLSLFHVSVGEQGTSINRSFLRGMMNVGWKWYLILNVLLFFDSAYFFSLWPSNTTVGLKWKVLAKILEPRSQPGWPGHDFVTGFTWFTSIQARFARITRLVHPVHQVGSPSSPRFTPVHLSVPPGSPFTNYEISNLLLKKKVYV